ncbi:uncharacterized protein [Tenebrio molitor]|uniref:uncharacterized protein n=1 Tax=Tenebrio molitor TaxID=7067 RepID=UPI003624A3EB
MLPSNISYGTVVGRFIRAIADGADPDRDPDGVALDGLIIRFTPSATIFKNATAEGGPVTIVADPIAVTTNADGVVVGPDGLPGVRLVATDDPDLQPTGWTWSVSITGANAPSIDFSFPLPSDATVDLTTLIPVPASPGESLDEWILAVTQAQAAASEASGSAADAEASAQAAALAAEEAGKSAYELAIEDGFVGTEAEWLESLNGTDGLDGDSAYEVAVADGFVGTEAEWLASLKGIQGDLGPSAYEVAVADGFVGDEAAWLASLNGTDGDSAYELAVAGGFVGTEPEWLASLNGADGVDGDSAYDLAVADGFIGTKAEWLTSLKGQDGAGTIASLTAGDNIVIDSTDPSNPVISSTGAVHSVNGQLGVVSIDAASVGAVTAADVDDAIAAIPAPTISSIAGLQLELDSKATSGEIPTTAAEVGAAEIMHAHSASQVTDFAIATDAHIAASTVVIKTSGDQSVAGVKTFFSAPVVPIDSFTIAKTSGLQAALDAKAAATDILIDGVVTEALLSSMPPGIYIVEP